MGTSNFHKMFASSYFVVDGRRYVDSDGEEYEEWHEGCDVIDDTEYVLDDILECAKSEGWAKSDRRVGNGDYGLCEKWEDEDLVLGKTPFEIKIEIIVRTGYYEACNLDWDIRIRVPGSGYDVRLSDFETQGDFGDDIFDAFMWYEHVWNEGLKQMQKRNVIKKALVRIDEVSLKADEFCRRMCTGVYSASAHFSNGETWYTRIV